MSDVDFTKLRVSELRELIQDKFGIQPEEITVKGKTNLVNMYLSLVASEDNVPEPPVMEELPKRLPKELEEESLIELNDLEVEVENNDVMELEIIGHDSAAGVDFERDITRTDPEWSDYVLQHLSPKEKFNDAPKSDGLRRLVELFVGRIIEIDNYVESVPTPDNGKIAVVRSRVTVDPYDRPNRPITYTGCAEAVSEYISGADFKKVLTAVAETKAEGRAYRKLLGLINVVTSDELIGSKSDSSEEEPVSSGATHANIKFIDFVCGNSAAGYNLNIREIFHKLTEKEYNSIYKYNSEDVDKIVGFLRKLQTAEKPERPEGINGYDANWRMSFA